MAFYNLCLWIVLIWSIYMLLHCSLFCSIFLCAFSNACLRKVAICKVFGHYPSVLYLLLLIISKFYLQLHHLMNTLIANETNSLVSNFFICICRVLWNLVHLTCDQIQEASNVDGRWCIKSGAGQITSFKGLLLSRWTLHAAKIVYFFFGLANYLNLVISVPGLLYFTFTTSLE